MVESLVVKTLIVHVLARARGSAGDGHADHRGRFAHHAIVDVKKQLTNIANLDSTSSSTAAESALSTASKPATTQTTGLASAAEAAPTEAALPDSTAPRAAAKTGAAKRAAAAGCAARVRDDDLGQGVRHAVRGVNTHVKASICLAARVRR